MKKRRSIKNIRRTSRAANAKRSKWAWGGFVAHGNVAFTDTNTMLYFDQSTASTITFDTSGFAVGDVITISGATHKKVKAKKKVHVARRRIKDIQETYVITDMNSSNITVAASSLVAVKKICDTQWIVNGHFL